ncbi:MAG: VanZ family protein [Clostridiales bacterium]|nr:VanZ family protein [Clostridiales bacterium]
MIKFLKNKYMRWLMVIVWMFVIFIMSHLNSVKSWYLTGEVLTVFQTGSVDTETTYEEKMSSYNEDETADLMVYIRKLAHVVEYMILGILVYYALSGSYAIRKSAVGSMSVGWFYGYLDELHQLFVPGRTGSLSDVFLDGIGVTLGVAFCVWAEVRLRKVRENEA